uniref:Uncharacterized protein n=2 Tax=Haptolina ericina TaxID=156174 RepID=A0A7S3APR2_9EUKA|mmetsp:Transcript_29406/g.66568  ORF Transcript_29406/g.66568 Transcript_29406/m.66568 type:complete len:113 (+) Transcript_29406:363-701(+)
MMRAMLPEMQEEIKKKCKKEYTWEITTERFANLHQSKKRYDFMLWRAEGHVSLASGGVQACHEQDSSRTVSGEQIKCADCNKNKVGRPSACPPVRWVCKECSRLGTAVRAEG